MGQTLNFGLDW